VRKSAFFFAILFCGFAPAQTPAKQTTHVGQVWLGYFNQTRFSDRWGGWFDVHMRTQKEVVSGWSHLLVRTGLTYYFSENARFTAGYVYANLFPDDTRHVSQPEHRPWQMFQWQTQYGRLRSRQTFRFEQRFRHRILNNDALADGYNFNYRLRYNLQFTYPLGKRGVEPGSLSVVASNEIFVNFGREIVYNYFDQNRFFVGLSYQTNATDNLQVGYMNLFQQQPSGNRYRNLHIFRVFFFHNLDWRRKSAEAAID
jgi:hypothetical protein